MYKFHKQVYFKEKITSLNLKNKVLKIGWNSRTSAVIGILADLPTSKIYNYFYTYRIEVIQKLRFSSGCLVSRKNIRKIKTQTYQTQKNQNRRDVQHALFSLFLLLFLIFLFKFSNPFQSLLNNQNFMLTNWYPRFSMLMNLNS